jgi:hypothetical protein
MDKNLWRSEDDNGTRVYELKDHTLILSGVKNFEASSIIHG